MTLRDFVRLDIRKGVERDKRLYLKISIIKFLSFLEIDAVA
jgi:hypothetical protein